MIIYPDGSLSNGDHLQIGSPYADVAVVALGKTGEILSVYNIGDKTRISSKGYQSDSNKPRITISRDYDVPTEKYYYRKSDGVTFFGKEYREDDVASTVPDVNVEEIEQGNMDSLGGNWISERGGQLTVELRGKLLGSGYIRLAADQDSSPGINLKLVNSKTEYPMILLPIGVDDGKSDASKDRLFFAGESSESDSSYYYYKK